MRTRATVLAVGLLLTACATDETPDTTAGEETTAPAPDEQTTAPAPTGAPTDPASEASAAGAASEPSGEGATAGAEVDVVDFAFEAADVTVATGDEISWTHAGDVSHTVTFTQDGPDSGSLSNGDTFATSFNEPGTYEYFCQFHSQMQGTVNVEG